RYDNTARADGTAVNDAWRDRQGGFRTDGGPSASAWTLQGDAYQSEAQVPNAPERRVSGGNVLGRWNRELRERAELQLQAYVDTYERRQPGFFNENLDTVDIDVQHRFAWGEGHETMWGGGYR